MWINASASSPTAGPTSVEPWPDAAHLQHHAAKCQSWDEQTFANSAPYIYIMNIL